MYVQKVERPDFTLKDWTPLAAGVATFGLAAFAMLGSYSIAEVFFSAFGQDLPILQNLSFQILQIVLVLFVLWPARHRLALAGSNLWAMVPAIAAGFLLAFWKNEALRHLLLPEVFPPEGPIQTMARSEMLLGSPFFHAAIWLFYRAGLGGLAEALLYSGYIFERTKYHPLLWVALTAIAFQTLAGAYSGGLPGALIYLRLAIVMALLRCATGSYLCSFVANATFSACDEGMALWNSLT